jgi:voltage-gated potassium channel
MGVSMRTREARGIVWSRYGFENLLVWLFLYLIIGPFLESFPYAHMVMNLFLTAVVFSAVYALDRSGKMLFISIALMAVTLILLWLNAFRVIRFPPYTISALLILYLATLVYSFSRNLFTVRRVTANVICAALCLYLIIGLLWGAVFALTESLAPGSFGGALLSNASTLEEKGYFLNYLSYITLTTLGYGDITPQTRSAVGLCQAEAMLGQFFAMILVARLVGIQVAQEASNPKEE